MKMSYKEIGDMIKKLRAGESVPCPECKSGVVSSTAGSKHNFHCNKCKYTVNIDQNDYFLYLKP